MIDPADTERLTRALTALGLRYAIHESTYHVYAGFRMTSPDGRSLHHTAIFQHGVLQVWARNLARLPLEEAILHRINELNRLWRLGRLQLDVEGELTAVVGCRIGATELSPQCVDEALFLLHDALASMDAFDTWIPPDWSQLSPANEPPLIASEVTALLQVLGHAALAGPDGLGVVLPSTEPGGHDCIIELAAIDQSTWVLHASPRPELDLAERLQVLNTVRRLNARVDVGVLLVGEKTSHVEYRIHMPRQWMAVDAENLGWHLDHSAAVLAALARSLAG